MQVRTYFPYNRFVGESCIIELITRETIFFFTIFIAVSTKWRIFINDDT